MVLTGRKLFIFFIVWLAVILLRMAWLAGDFSNWRRIETQTVAGRTGKLPALRGTIYDSGGNKLAWSEKYYDLVISGTLYDEEIDYLKSLLPKRVFPAVLPLDHTIYKLDPDEVISLESALKKFPALQIKSRVERICVRSRSMPDKIGTVDPQSGRGISGWEKEFDRQLSGTDGEFRVLLDRNGSWIDSSWEIKTMPVRGRDVVIDLKTETQVPGASQ